MEDNKFQAIDLMVGNQQEVHIQEGSQPQGPKLEGTHPFEPDQDELKEHIQGEASQQKHLNQEELIGYIQVEVNHEKQVVVQIIRVAFIME